MPAKTYWHIASKKHVKSGFLLSPILVQYSVLLGRHVKILFRCTPCFQKKSPSLLQCFQMFYFLLDISFEHFRSNDNCSHFGAFGWLTHKGGRRHVGQRLVGQIWEDGSAADDADTITIVSRLSKDTHWARTPLMSPEHQWTPIESRHHQSCSGVCSLLVSLPVLW